MSAQVWGHQFASVAESLNFAEFLFWDPRVAGEVAVRIGEEGG